MKLPPLRALLDVPHALALAAITRLRGSSPRPLLHDVLVEVMRRDMGRLTRLPPDAQRARYLRLSTPLPFTLDVTRDAAQVGGVDAEWFSPPSSLPGALIYLHGGAYIVGSSKTHADLIGRLALSTRRRALGVNYRLAPQHRVEDAVEDVLAVYRALLRDTSPSQIALIGDSAGGGLAFSTLLRMRDLGVPMPAAVVGICPWVDMRGLRPSYRENDGLDLLQREDVARWTQIVSRDRPRVGWPRSPIDCDLCGLPPTLLHAGGRELLRDDVIAFAERLDWHGVESRLVVWSEMCHDFHLFAPLSAIAREAIDDIGAFLRGALDQRDDVDH